MFRALAAGLGYMRLDSPMPECWAVQLYACCVLQHTEIHLLHTPLFCELRKFSTAVCVGKCYSFSIGEAETGGLPQVQGHSENLSPANKLTENYCQFSQ